MTAVDQSGIGRGTGDGMIAAAPAVACEGLVYRFGEQVAVNDVDLGIRHGETFGPNGAGKTTTIRMLTTLLKPAAGRVLVSGAAAAGRPMLVRRMIGYVPQLLSADGNPTGRENVRLFARLFDVPRAQRATRVAEALGAMRLADAADRAPGEPVPVGVDGAIGAARTTTMDHRHANEHVRKPDAELVV